MVKARAQTQETGGAVDQARQSLVETIRRVTDSLRSLLSTLAGSAKAVLGRIRTWPRAAPRAAGEPDQEASAAGKSQPKSEQADPAIAAKPSVDEKPGQMTPMRPAQVVERAPSARPASAWKAEEPAPAAPKPELEVDAIFEGDVELAIAVPIDLAALAKLYNYLQSTPDIKILYTRGSLDRGTTITVSLDKPVPFIGMVSRISGLKIERTMPQKDRTAGASGSLLGAKRPEAARIDLALRME